MKLTGMIVSEEQYLKSNWLTVSLSLWECETPISIGV